MKRYKNYKIVSLPWLKSIPEHWEIKRNKGIFTELKEQVGSNASKYMLLSLTLNGIIPRNMEGGGKFPSSFDKYKIVKSGDMAFCLFDIDETPRTVGLSKYDGMLTGAYTIMRVNNAVPKYIYYYYLSLDNIKALKVLYKGLRKTINVNSFQSIGLPFPPESEQEQIACFLDWKMSEIKKLISSYKKRISILGEMRTNIINKAVINGIRNSKLVHHDNISWDIRFPMHWKLQKTREFFSFRKGLTITKDNLRSNGIAVINYGQVHSKKNSGVGLNSDLIRFVDESYLVSNQSSVVEKGDFIFADTSEDFAGCGNCAYIDWDDTIFAGYHTIIAHPYDKSNNKYLAYLFQTPTWRYQIQKNVAGVKVYSITQRILKNLFIIIPPEDEQKEIVNYLDGKCEIIDKLVINLENKIRVLNDLKIVLISNVVTGRIDVHDIAIPEYEDIKDDFDINDEDIDIEEASDSEDEED